MLLAVIASMAGRRRRIRQHCARRESGTGRLLRWRVRELGRRRWRSWLAEAAGSVAGREWERAGMHGRRRRRSGLHAAEALGVTECGEHVARRHDSIALDSFLEIRSSQHLHNNKHGPHELRTSARPARQRQPATAARSFVVQQASGRTYNSPHLGSV